MRKLFSIIVAVLLVPIFLLGCTQSSDKNEAKTVGEKVNYEIIGIDPGAGVMKNTQKAIEEYDLKDWKLVESSNAAMLASLEKEYKKEKPVIITGWTPHWIFTKYDLKFLEDPKKVYGTEEGINTIVRKGLEKDDENLYTFLDNFYWTPEEMGNVMTSIEDGASPQEAAKEWVKNNQDKISKWFDGVEKDKGNGKIVKLAYVAWDTEIASTNVVAYLLKEELGYEVDLSQVEAGVMWAGISSGDADATVCAWLPTTQADYYKKFKGQFVDLGPNLEGTKLGLVVPKYMEINSIEDLKK